MAQKVLSSRSCKWMHRHIVRTGGAIGDIETELCRLCAAAAFPLTSTQFDLPPSRRLSNTRVGFFRSPADDRAEVLCCEGTQL